MDQGMAIRALVTSRLTRKAQTTVPKKVRDVLKVGPGDLLGYEIRDNRVILTRVEGLDRPYLRALQETLSEWNSEDDAAAYDDL
jgi:antitoxin PrlF